MSSEAIKEAPADPDRNERGQFRSGHRYSFQPGVSGNPLGRRASITDHIRRKVDELLPGDSRTRAEAIADVLLTLACGGNIQAAKEVLDRVEGRVRQGIDLGLSSNMSDAEIEEALVAAGLDLGTLRALDEKQLTLTAGDKDASE